MPEIPEIFTAWDPSLERRRYIPGSTYGGRRVGGTFSGGGVTSSRTGMGNGRDNGYYKAETPISRSATEIPFVQSWALHWAISIPALVTMAKWRRYLEDEDTREGLVDGFKKAEKKYRVAKKIADARIAADLTGTALMVMFTNDAPMEKKLDPSRIRVNGLRNLTVYDRYSADVESIQEDPMLGPATGDPEYGMPSMYRIYPDDQRKGFSVHASRVLRFDGIAPLTVDGWDSYSQERSDWGLSRLTNLMLPAIQDDIIVQSITDLATEASVPVLKMFHYKEYLDDEEDFSQTMPGSVPSTRLAESLQLRSNYKAFVIDAKDDLMRVNVPMAGWPNLTKELIARIAAAAQIPQAYLLGRSPGGLDSTGEGDMDNFAMRIAWEEEHNISPVLDDRLDLVLAKTAGFDEPPDYEWNSLIDQSDQERADVLDKVTMALERAINAYAIDNEEFRSVIKSQPIVTGNLEGPAPEAPEEPDPMDC